MPLNYQSSMLAIVNDSFVTTYVSNNSCTFNISSCQTHHSSHVSLPSLYILDLIMPSYSNPINHRPNIRERKRTPNWTAFSPSSSLRQRSLAQARESLAQVSSLHLGENEKTWNSGLYTVSLRRDPPCLGKKLAHPK